MSTCLITLADAHRLVDLLFMYCAAVGIAIVLGSAFVFLLDRR